MPTIQARITEVTQNVETGWYRIATDDDVIKALETSIAEKGHEAGQHKRSGALLEINYSEKSNPNKINPHTQKPYINRYYERAEPIDEPEADDGITLVTPPSRTTAPQDAWRMSLGAGAKLAVNTMPLMPAEQRTFETQKKIAYAWAIYLFFTPVPVPEPELKSDPTPDPEAEGIPF